MDFADLQAAWLVMMGLCGAIITLGGAIAVCVKLYSWARKPTEDAQSVLEEHDTWFAADKRRIEALEKRQDEADEMNRLQLQALVTLLGHEIDGNHTSQLKEVRDEIQMYLINKA